MFRNLSSKADEAAVRRSLRSRIMRDAQSTIPPSTPIDMRKLDSSVFV
jgi:hypothetical protein